MRVLIDYFKITRLLALKRFPTKILCVLLHANVDHSQRFTLIHFSTLKFSFISCLTNSFLTGLVGEGVPASQKFTKRVIDAGSLSLTHVLGLVS